MANKRTSDIKESVAQCIRILQSGADYVRFTVPSMSDVEAFATIKKEVLQQGYQTPIIADVHFNPEIAVSVAQFADKVRINPGNFGDPLHIIKLINICRERGVAIRIGVNHGSLSAKIMEKFGDTPAGMAESAMEYLRICREHQFDQVVVSMKASNVRVMIYATRMLVKMMEAEGMKFPLHLGVTEAGEGEDGRVKSAVGIGTLLADGIGDTIRVSLTEEPEAELPVAVKLLDYVQRLSAALPLPVDETGNRLLFDLFNFSRRKTRITGNLGGNFPPVVFGFDQLDEHIQFSHASFDEINDSLIHELSVQKMKILVYTPKYANVQAELRWLNLQLLHQECDAPVMIKLNLNEPDIEDFMIRAAADLGGSFIDGFGDGLWLTNSYPMPLEKIHSVALGILQACRARMSKTEYISCPSCGRTHFNLMDTLARIKAATSHLKGLKIGVMGCIVNGPGEMADADYGYVGAGKGKITLYKAKDVVKRGIPEEQALAELIALIKENGDWKEEVESPSP